jgi:hypothetical protein
MLAVAEPGAGDGDCVARVALRASGGHVEHFGASSKERRE